MTTCDSVEFHHEVLASAYAQASKEPLTEHPVLKLHGDMPATERTGLRPDSCTRTSQTASCSKVRRLCAWMIVLCIWRVVTLDARRE